MGPVGAYALTIDAIGRPGGLIWANSTISLSEDVKSETNRLITRLENTLGLIAPLEDTRRTEQLEKIEEILSQHDSDVGLRTQALELKLEALLGANGQKIDGVAAQSTELGEKQDMIKEMIAQHGIDIDARSQILETKLDRIKVRIKRLRGKRKGHKGSKKYSYYDSRKHR